MTFGLDRYEPVAFHTYPALMRAADARTEVLQPPADLSASTVAIATTQADKSAEMAPAEPVAAYLVAMEGTAVLRKQLADFLDAAGSRQDVRVSVGVSGGSSVEWVLREAVPYGVRALPRYPLETSTGDPAAVLEAVGTELADDALKSPERRRLVVLVWDRPPVPVRFPRPLASALVLHCVDVVLDWPPPDRQDSSLLLARSRPWPSRSLLAQAGRLLTGWDAFTEVPEGLVLIRSSR
jgi:hypothetical protein